MTFLSITNLHKTFPTENSKAVTGIDLDIQQGEIIGVLGESGCGKSTLLRLIAGLEQPDSGKIEIEGQQIIGPEHKLVAGHEDITLVHQHYDLFPNHTVFENVFEALKTYEEDEVKNEQVSGILDTCRLSEYKNKFPRELSGGQQQRVALARALINKPKLLLLDEPFSDLDSILKSALKKDIYQIIKETGTTAILVTHDAKDALPICDSILIMKDGNLIQQGTPEVIYNEPRTKYVAKFCGTVSIFPFDIITPSSTKYAAIRPEHITLNQNFGIEALVESVRFMGSHYEVIAVSKTNVWYLNLIEETVQSGDTVFLELQKDKVIVFE